MDYLLYISNQGEYTSLFRKQDDGSLISPIVQNGGTSNSPGITHPSGKQHINKNYKYYPRTVRRYL